MHLDLYCAACLMWVAYFINFKGQFLVSSFLREILLLLSTIWHTDFDALILALALWHDLPDAFDYNSVG